MKHWIILIAIWCSFSAQIQAQEADTLIRDFTATLPFLRDCRTPMGGEKDSMADQILFMYLSEVIQYPYQAREAGVEGTVFIRFVVEKDGRTSQHQVLRGIGSGCDEEAIRAIKMMPDYSICWEPAYDENNKIVRCRFNIPVKFKLKEPLPYQVYEQDSVYNMLDSASLISYRGGSEAMLQQLRKIKLSKADNDSCVVATFDCNLIVRPDGTVKIVDLFNYAAADMDSEYEAIVGINNTRNNWTSATYRGKPVAALTNFTFLVRPTNPGCATSIANVEKAVTLANAAQQDYAAEQADTAIAKISEAIRLYPRNAEFLYIRGMMYFNANTFPEACADLSEVKKRMNANWFDDILPIICKQK